jgi:hypothetical protein
MLSGDADEMLWVWLLEALLGMEMRSAAERDKRHVNQAEFSGGFAVKSSRHGPIACKLGRMIIVRKKI